MISKIRPYRGGQQAPAGTYWNAHSGDYVTVAGAGMLPAGDGIYVRAHPLLILALGSLMGLMFVMFLPLAVPLVVGRSILNRIRGTETGGRYFRRAHGRPCPAEVGTREPRLPMGSSR